MKRSTRKPPRTDHALDPARRRKIAEALGPMPRASLAAMLDYGLSDVEIGRYYGLSRDTIARLRADWKITGRL